MAPTATMATSATMAPQPTVDARNQDLLFTLPDGDMIPIPLEQMDAFVQYGIRICINYATQIGASVLLLFVVLILTKAEKRKSNVFMLNTAALAFNIVRNVIQCTYFTGSFYSTYVYWSGDYESVPKSDLAASIVGVIFSTLLMICIEASLILQVRAVCVTMTRAWRMAALILSASIATAVIAFRITLLAYNARAIVNLDTFYDYQWLAASSLYIETASICFFSAIFSAKLAYALKQRRSLGLSQFGPMQVIFIMGLQTMLIPALFSILQWVSSVPELGSQVQTLVALFLPLSAMWAAKTLNGGSSLPAMNSKGRSGLFGFLSGRDRASPATTKESTSVSLPTTAVGEHNGSRSPPSTLAFAAAKNADLETGDLKIYRRDEIEVTMEKA